jgi:hypothetical protein
MCSLIYVHRILGGMHCYRLQERRVNQASNKDHAELRYLFGAYLLYSSTLEIEAVNFTDTSLDIDHITWCNIPHHSTLHS